MNFNFFLAPGTYCPEKVYSPRGPQYSLSGKGPSQKISDIPGIYFLNIIFILSHFLN